MRTLLKIKLVKWLSALLRRRDYLLVKSVFQGQLSDFFSRYRPIMTGHELIRLGSAGDGGYLVPDDLEHIDACFSPGVAQLAEFELALTKKGIPCFLADGSVDQPPIQTKLIEFEKKHLGMVESRTHMTLDEWVQRKAPGRGDLILQMDIEGDEYEVIYGASRNTLQRFRILVIEFHRLHKMIEPHFFKMVDLAFAKLGQDFELVHLHPNNDRPPLLYKGLQIPPIMEFTYLRKDRVNQQKPNTEFPHPLDSKNVLNKPDYPLPACWYLEGLDEKDSGR
jgi:hypothetical protein